MHVAAVFALGIALTGTITAPVARAETIGGNPGPEYNYVCPHADDKPALDCYFDAVAHLYTMCRNVKAIEIIEFGYEDSREGVNAAKSISCLDKQKQNIVLPYQAALKQAKISKQAVEGLRSLQEMWLTAMIHLQWHSGESAAEYQARVAKPYDEFNDRIAGIRTIVSIVETHTEPAPAAQTTKKAKSQPKATTH